MEHRVPMAPSPMIAARFGIPVSSGRLIFDFRFSILDWERKTALRAAMQFNPKSKI
jgi:hypothetical protein